MKVKRESYYPTAALSVVTNALVVRSPIAFLIFTFKVAVSAGLEPATCDKVSLEVPHS